MKFLDKVVKLFKKTSPFDDPTYIPDWLNFDFNTMDLKTYDIYGNVAQEEFTMVITEHGKWISIDNINWKAYPPAVLGVKQYTYRECLSVKKKKIKAYNERKSMEKLCQK